MRPVSEQFFDDWYRLAVSDVIGVWFEGKSEDADGFSFQLRDMFLEDFDEPEWLVSVDSFGAFNDTCVFFDFFCPGDERVNVLGETGAAPAYS